MAGAPTEAVHLTKASVNRYRSTKWRLSEKRRLRTRAAAARFIDDVGLCLLFACDYIDLPKLYRSAHRTADWWPWKDQLQAAGKCYSGRVVRRKATLISMRLLPYFLSLYFDSGGYEVYDEEHFYGRLSESAKRICDFLAEHGPTPTDELRAALAIPGKKGTRTFHAALLELQLKFKIVTVGLKDKSWGVRVLDLFSNWVPQPVLDAARQCQPQRAMAEIALAYVRTAGIADTETMYRIFGWEKDRFADVAEQLVTSGTLRTGTLPRDTRTFLASPQLTGKK